MEAHRKAAYRDLLYWAMLDIRRLSSIRTGGRWWNPLRWREMVREARRAGDIADWLHNLAIYSRSDFEGFSEDWFWKEYARYCQGNPDFDRSGGYKEQFERVVGANENRGAEPRGSS